MGLGWMDGSPGGRGYRAPYGANNRRLIGGCLYSLVLVRGLFFKRFPSLIPALCSITFVKFHTQNFPLGDQEVMIGKCGGVLNLFYSHELPTQYAVSYIVVTSQPDQRTILFVKKKKFSCLPYCCLKDFTGLHMKEKIKSVPLQPFFWRVVFCA